MAGTTRIVITGASSGIGRELAFQLAAPGKEIWLVARNTVRLEEVAGKVRAAGAIAHVVSLDLGDIENTRRFFTSFPEIGLLDELYLCAAVSIFGEVVDILYEDWVEVYQTDLLSYAQWAHAAYEGMVRRGSGRIVILSSLTAYTGYPTSVPYAAMKAGLLGLFRTLRPEGNDHGVKVHLVSPGYVKTDIFRAAIYRRYDPESNLKAIKDQGFRIMEPDEAALSILKGIARGREEIIFPAYGKILAWLGPRFPLLLRGIHRSMVKRLKNAQHERA